MENNISKIGDENCYRNKVAMCGPFGEFPWHEAACMDMTLTCHRDLPSIQPQPSKEALLLTMFIVCGTTPTENVVDSHNIVRPMFKVRFRVSIHQIYIQRQTNGRSEQ